MKDAHLKEKTTWVKKLEVELLAAWEETICLYARH